jgi:hypothetical protein
VSSKVIFALTEVQSEALLAIREARRVPGDVGGGRTRLFLALQARGFIQPDKIRGVRLTELGYVAAVLCDRLAKMRAQAEQRLDQQFPARRWGR